MRRQIIAKTGTGTTSWIPVDYSQANFALGFGAVVSGTITYDIEHTFDDVYDSAVTPTAFKHETLTGQTTSQDGNYAFPITAVRVNNTSGTGTTTLTIIQGRNR